MLNYTTPGIYFERPRPRAAAAGPRTDVAGFAGVAERGPLHTPVRLVNWREYQAVFGGFLPHAYLAYAVYAFFENGGAVCWVVRVAAADQARPASLLVPAADSSPALVVRAIDPGAWGDRLAVALSEAAPLQTRHVPLVGLAADQLAVERTADFLAGSRVRLSQQGGAGLVTQLLNVVGVNAVTGVLTFDAPLSPAFDLGVTTPPAPAITVEALALDVQVLLDNQPLERFNNLAYLPDHPRYAPAIVNEASRQIRLEPAAGFLGAQLPFPLVGQDGRLRGGLDGLRTLDLDDYLGGDEPVGLGALARVDEVAVLAMPDLVMRATSPPPSRRSRRVPIDPCALGAPRTDFRLCVTVLDAETRGPLPGVTVTVDDGVAWPGEPPAPRVAITGPDGRACFDHLLPRDIDLLVAGLPGYDEHVERLAAPPAGVEVLLRPRATPPPLSDDDIFLAQSAMITQCERLRDRFAVLDAPLNRLGQPRDLAEVREWRARFDSEYAALYHPWLIVNDPAAPPGQTVLPPSGHVAGVYAAVDLAQGVHRAPANRALAFADNVTLAIDDAMHGFLNPAGINAIRPFPGRGIRVFGARTLMTTRGAVFVNERRYLNWLIETLHEGLQWAVFEPQNPDTEAALRLWISRLLDEQWRRGALVGTSPEAAYAVRVDDTTTTEDDRANGRLIAEVDVALTVPYEFIVLRLGFTLDELTISEL